MLMNMDTPILSYLMNVKPLNCEWREYNSVIGDYGGEIISVNNRIVPPYLGSSNHGGKFYDDVIGIVNQLHPKSVIDLGCGAGELLSKIKSDNRFLLS